MAFTAGGGDGIKDVKKVEKKDQAIDITLGLGGSCGVLSSVGSGCSVLSFWKIYSFGHYIWNELSIQH